MRAPVLLTALLSLANACAAGRHYGGDLGAIAGSEPRLQPRIASATANASGGQNPRILVSFDLPQRSYVSYLHVFTQVSVGVLAPPGVGRSTGLEATEPGRHKLELRELPTFVDANAERAGRVRNATTVAGLGAHDSPNPIKEYALVIVTEKPMTLDDLRGGLLGIELRGSDDAVLANIAQSVGARSGGAWSASATQPAWQAAPF